MIYTAILASNPVREVFVRETKVYRENQRICIQVKGDVDELSALKTKEAVLKIMASIAGEVDLLIDMKLAGNQTIEAKNIFSSLNDMGQTRKTALIGSGFATRITNQLIMAFPHKKNIGIFKTSQGALNWFER